MGKDKDNSIIKKHNRRKRIETIGAILYLLFLCDRIFIAIVQYKYGMDNIDYIKAALFSIALCTLIGILFFGLRSGDEYIEILEAQNEIYREKIQKLKAENDYLHDQNMKFRRNISDLKENNIIKYPSKRDQ